MSVRVIQGEIWEIKQLRRGWEARCESLELTAKAPTEEALIAEIEYLLEAMCV